jgi:hypothetical protein
MGIQLWPHLVTDQEKERLVRALTRIGKPTRSLLHLYPGVLIED